MEKEKENYKIKGKPTYVNYWLNREERSNNYLQTAAKHWREISELSGSIVAFISYKERLSLQLFLFFKYCLWSADLCQVGVTLFSPIKLLFWLKREMDELH
jgi:hypothetical protein